MSRFSLTRALAAKGWSLGVALGFALTLGACVSPQVGSPCPVPDNGTMAEKAAALSACLGEVGEQVVDTRLKKDVDILFAIDNSPSMTPKQTALANNIPKFIKIIDGTGANYHVGIATSDVGADVGPGQPWGSQLGSCDTYAGDNGVLQDMPCTQRNNGTAEARNACSMLCPNDRYVPTDGNRFISKVNGLTNVPSDPEVDPQTGKMVDNGPIDAFQCLALVGDGGCGIEGQLEGAKRALDPSNSENANFLRDDSVLAIIFITDEDDCSVQLSQRSTNNPSTMDCPTADPNAPYSCYNVDYRCIATDVQCDQAMNTTGAKTNCSERSNSRLYPVESYYSFFSSLRTQDKLLISGIWTQPSITNGGQLNIALTTGGTDTSFLNRAPGPGASCVYSGDPNVYGQAQLRLSKFAKLFGNDASGMPNALEVSICDIDNYDSALSNIANAITAKLNGACLPLIPKTDSNGQPMCLVGDVDDTSPNNSPDTYFPVCSQGCCNAWAASAQPTAADPNIQSACMAETADCYCAIKSTANPPACPGTVVAGVWRQGDAMPPSDKVTNFRCAGGGM
jgi:hypothetical protein